MTDPAWTNDNLNNPHSAPDKAKRVEQMFAAIAPKYDLNNRLHSLWQDQYWRRTAVKIAGIQPGAQVVDVACGTGDLSLAFAKKLHKLSAGAGDKGAVTGIDFTYEMLSFAQKKSQQHSNDEQIKKICWLNGDAMALPLSDNCCDVVSIAFGIRNVSDPSKAMAEFKRILRPGGRLIILEFTTPTIPLLGALYKLYSQRIMPHTASWISRDKSGAYKYLPKSVSTFVDKKGMISLLEQTGFEDVSAKSMSLGVSTCYKADKPAGGE